MHCSVLLTSKFNTSSFVPTVSGFLKIEKVQYSLTGWTVLSCNFDISCCISLSKYLKEIIHAFYKCIHNMSIKNSIMRKLFLNNGLKLPYFPLKNHLNWKWSFYSRQACYRSKIININWNQWDVRVFEIWYHNHKVWLLLKRYKTYKFSWKLIERIFVTCTLDCIADFNYLKFFSWSFLVRQDPI